MCCFSPSGIIQGRVKVGDYVYAESFEFRPGDSEVSGRVLSIGSDDTMIVRADSPKGYAGRKLQCRVSTCRVMPGM